MKTLLALILVSLLTACGGGDPEDFAEKSDSKTPTTPSRESAV
jgi:hypothetical protein